MNKGMIMLGLLIIVGISFAELREQCWANMATYRYECNYDVSYQGVRDGSGFGYDSLAEYLAGEDSKHDYSQYLDNMALYLNQIGPGSSSMLLGLDGMNANLCPEENPYSVPPAFRTYMKEYNTYSVLFRREFNSFLTAYLANNPGERSEVLGYLSGIRADYLGCIVLRR